MDLNGWLFMRVSGVFLVVALLLHLVENYFLGTKLAGPILAFIMNAGIVGLVLSHGLVGLSRIIGDQGLPRRAQTVLAWTLAPVGLVGAYFSTAAMLKFGLL